MSARHYAKWDLFEGRNPFAFCEPVPAEAADCCCLLYTPAVTNTPRSVRSSLDDGMMLLHALVDRTHGPLFPESPSSFSARCELVIVDEADRLSTSSIEELRDFYDRSKIGLVLVGMPGLEKRLARYAQFYCAQHRWPRHGIEGQRARPAEKGRLERGLHAQAPGRVTTELRAKPE